MASVHFFLLLRRAVQKALRTNVTWMPIARLMVDKRHCVVWTTVVGDSVSVKSKVSHLCPNRLPYQGMLIARIIVAHEKHQGVARTHYPNLCKWYLSYFFKNCKVCQKKCLNKLDGLINYILFKSELRNH